jgi:hypothetical protein
LAQPTGMSMKVICLNSEMVSDILREVTVSGLGLNVVL